MIILSAQNIAKAFGVNTVLRDVSLTVQQGDRIGLVGVNGCGKSTLMRILAGLDAQDSGEISLVRGTRVGYLAQQNMVTSGETVWNELQKVYEPVFVMEKKLRELEDEMAHAHTDEQRFARLSSDYDRLIQRFEEADGYAWKSMVSGVLNGLGFKPTQYDQCVDSLSGGEQTRLCLARLLLQKPDLLLLDEPTNHLDMETLQWLENYLSAYKGSVLVISHDRYFLDHVCTGIVEILMGSSEQYNGNYTRYIAQRQERFESRMRAYEIQQKEIERQQAIIARYRMFNREKSIKRAESREKMLEKMQTIEKPIEVNTDIHLKLEPSCVSGNDVLTIEHLSKSFPGQELFTDVNLEIKRGEHVAVIGDNGTGKTTLLKILNRVVSADSGTYTLGSNVKIGYYDQEHHVLHMEKTIFDEISDDYPTLTNTEIRNVLAAFLFTGDDVFKQISSLSGGERGRVSLAKLMLSEANFLILDEPTNHLDIASKEILENALNDYTGTVLYVSHDRYFINQTASRILDLVNHTFVNYIGNYDYYLEKKEELTTAYAGAASTPSSVSDNSTDKNVSESKLSWQEQKEAQARLRKRQNELKKTEERIGELEDRDSKIDALMIQEDIFTNSVKCQELAKEKAAIAEELEELYMKWEELAEDA